MKKIKSLAAWALALAFFAPTALLFACQEKDSLSAPPVSSESAVSPDTETENEETPPAQEPPQEPETQPEEILPPTPIKQEAEYIRCIGDSVNLRSGAGTSYSVLGSAEKGTSYTVLEKKGNWYKTYYRNKTAYIYATYATVFTLEKTEDTDVENVITEGYKTLGVPYVYGAVRIHDGNGKLLKGFSPQKFDCSSLIQYIFYKGAGVLLRSNTRTQVTQGKKIAKENIERGDCLYFTNEDRQYNTGIERVGHVALYLGDDYILHTSSDYARIEKMTATRWKFFIEARRFL